jgi:hypothetical protein
MRRKAHRDPVSAERLDTLRGRLAEGFYERPDVEDAIARAVRRELDQPFPAAQGPSVDRAPSGSG